MTKELGSLGLAPGGCITAGDPARRSPPVDWQILARFKHRAGRVRSGDLLLKAVRAKADAASEIAERGRGPGAFGQVGHAAH
jgi:hypothetical protein